MIIYIYLCNIILKQVKALSSSDLILFHSRNFLFIECFLLGIAFKAIFLRVWSDSHDNYDTLEHESNMTKMRYVCRRSKFYSNLYSISCKLLPPLFLKKIILHTAEKIVSFSLVTLT